MTDDQLTWMSAGEIRDLAVAGALSAVEIADHFLGRIDEFDPTLKAFAHLDAEGAREQAAAADRARRAGDTLGPLHGVPVSVKENIAVKDVPFGFPRTGRFGVSSADAIVVERLRAAGAILVGTNTMMGTGGRRAPDARPEAPVLDSYNWDVEARNPWDPTRVPGWSSSGGAASVAAALLPAAIGSDGGGSTRLPAAFTGVTGVHTTRGLIPYIDYERPIFRLTASNGPITRSVRDAALITQALAGPDGRDYLCIPHDPADYLSVIDEDVRGMRFAWTDDFGYASTTATAESPRVLDTARAAAFALRERGAIVEKVCTTWESANRPGGPGPGEPSAYEIEISKNPPPLPPTDPAQYRAEMEWRARTWDVFSGLFKEYDLLLTVTSQHIAPTIADWDSGWTRDPHGYGVAYVSHTLLCNLLGLPAVSVPCGLVDGMPIALQIIGPPSSEDRIFKAAMSFERLLPAAPRPAIS